jgi:hypothetical protein
MSAVIDKLRDAGRAHFVPLEGGMAADPRVPVEPGTLVSSDCGSDEALAVVIERLAEPSCKAPRWPRGAFRSRNRGTGSQPRRLPRAGPAWRTNSAARIERSSARASRARGSHRARAFTGAAGPVARARRFRPCPVPPHRRSGGSAGRGAAGSSTGRTRGAEVPALASPPSVPPAPPLPLAPSLPPRPPLPLLPALPSVPPRPTTAPLPPVEPPAPPRPPPESGGLPTE